MQTNEASIKESLDTAREHFSSGRFPYKVIRLGELEHITGGIYKLGGAEFQLSPKAQRTIDSLAKVHPEVLRKAGGDEKAKSAFRNYMMQLYGNLKVALRANPETLSIGSATWIQKDVITPEEFFEMLEYIIKRFDIADEHPRHFLEMTDDSFSIALKPKKSEIADLGAGERFSTNGIYISWDLNQIETGSYIERQICTNGAVATFKENADVTHSFLETSKIFNIQKDTFADFSQSAETAMRTKASVREMSLVAETLVRNGVSEQTAEQLIPCEECLHACELRGIPLSKAIGGMTIWDLFNALTYADSHIEGELNRFALNDYAMRFLAGKKRDVREYEYVNV